LPVHGLPTLSAAEVVNDVSRHTSQPIFLDLLSLISVLSKHGRI
jgi:hypothetical protein